MGRITNLEFTLLQSWFRLLIETESSGNTPCNIAYYLFIYSIIYLFE